MEKDRWELGRIGGIPVAMHWTVLLWAIWLPLWYGSIWGLLLGAPALVVVYLVHEFGHVYAARRRRIGVYNIVLEGLHGRTGRATASHGDEVAVAWAGVVAQMLLLVAALIVSAFVVPLLPAAVQFVVGPVLFVWTVVNPILAVIALLPIGPFDGHQAWQVTGLVKARWKRRSQPKPVTEKQQRDLHKRTEAEVVDLMERLKKKQANEKQANGKDTLH